MKKKAIIVGVSRRWCHQQ